MYVRATTIEGRHGRLPGGIEIAWQGAGMDRGNTIVQKDGRWYLTRDLAGSVALHGSVGGEALDGTVLSLEVFPGLRQETLGSLDLCR